MKKHNENQFINKFRILHSQESSEDITWSCSDSSDYEYDNVQRRTLNNITNGIGRKRKRANNRKKELKNISNLDITISDSNTERNSSVISAKSPILLGKSRSGVMQTTSISTTALQLTNQRKFVDSALTSNNNLNVSTDWKPILKSPVIHFKNNSPKISLKVKKKLFTADKCHGGRDEEDIQSDRCTSPILSSKKNSLHRRQCVYSSNKNKVLDKSKLSDVQGNKYVKDHQSNYNVTDRINKCSQRDDLIEYSSSEESGSKKELVTKVKSFFDNHFSSEASQISISECETSTPRSNSKSSNDIDMATPKTQERNVVSLSKISSTNTFESHIQKKKVKYKKGGFSYRLNELLKKQNSSVYLWQHERFLAANSNFVIPKQEFLVYRIRSVCFKYGIYSLEIVNRHDELFIALINSLYVNNNTFEVDSVLKIYEPFKIVDTDIGKIISNICKFECEKLIF